jgi:hypothetical protein
VLHRDWIIAIRYHEDVPVCCFLREKHERKPSRLCGVYIMIEAA